MLKPSRLALALGAALTLAAPLAAQIYVDNEGAGFTILTGTWSTGAYGQPYGTNYNWATTTGYGSPPAECEWRPTLPQAGVYQVATWYVQGGNRANNAPFTVHHAGGETTVLVNQQSNGHTWVDLGTYSFAAGTSGYVRLANSANPSVVIADAVRFTLVGSTVSLIMAVEPVGGGTTTPVVGGPYAYALNTVVPLAATPLAGYDFHHWSVIGGVGPADAFAADTTIVMDQDKTVTAIFVDAQPAGPEFRGFWADAFHTGYKSAAQIDDLVARAVQGNYNAILPEVLAFQDNVGSGHGAYWHSAIVPWAAEVNGGFDPLEYLVDQAHAAGLEVHPWLVAFRICSTWPPAGNALLAAHPEWTMVPLASINGGPAKVSNYYVLDPGSPDVQAYLLSIVRELIDNYEIDGIHWDYIRYTTTDAGYPAYSWYTRSGLARFKAIYGYAGTPAIDYGPWNDFRRREITELMRRVQVDVATRALPRQLRHSAALITWGNAPANFTSTSAWQLFQNWREWNQLGFLDLAIPMTYYDYDVYPTWYENWVDQALVWRYDRQLAVGPGIYMNDFADSVTEIQYAQNAGADGICTYSYAVTRDDTADWTWYSDIAPIVFPAPAEIPAMPWRDPLTTTKGAVYGRVALGASGQAVDNATVKINGTTVAQTDGNGFFVVTQREAAALGTLISLSAVAPGYAEVSRPAVLLERAGYTEANLALGPWLAGDYDVDGDVDADDLDQFTWFLTGPDNGPILAGGDLFDFDADADLDLRDFAELQ